MSHNDVAIALEGLRKTFRIGFRRKRVTALRDATFEVPRGAVFGLVGPNGAGKTTTIKILMGLLRASGGRASILGEPVPSVQSRRRVGYLPENPHFYDHLEPLEFLVYTGSLYGLRRTQSRRRGLALLERVGLSDHLAKPIRKFSKGMVQRLGIAQSLIHDPDLVILDEPQSGLDPLGRKEVKDLIGDLGERGRTVFFSSHILQDVEDVCDQVAVLIGGRIRDVGRLDTLLNPRVLETEIEVGGLEGDLVTDIEARAHQFTRTERSLVARLPGEVDIDPLVARIVQTGGTIHRIIRHRESLEDVFVREARESETRS